MRSSASFFIKGIVLSLTFAAAASACFRGEEGNGVLGEQEVSVESDFTRISSAACVDGVRVEAEAVGDLADGSPKLSISGDSNLLDRILVNVKSGELFIECDGSFTPQLGLTLHVQVPKLDTVTSGGNGEFRLINATADEFVIKHSGSGTMRVDQLKATTLTVNAAGSTSVQLEGVDAVSFSMNVFESSTVIVEGHTKSLEVDAKEAGSLDALSLQAETVHATVVDSGSALVCALISVDGLVSEDGRLEYDCAPMSVDVAVEGDGIATPH